MAAHLNMSLAGGGTLILVLQKWKQPMFEWKLPIVKSLLCWIFAGCLFNKSLCRVGYEWCYDGELQKKYLLSSCSVYALDAVAAVVSPDCSAAVGSQLATFVPQAILVPSFKPLAAQWRPNCVLPLLGDLITKPFSSFCQTWPSSSLFIFDGGSCKSS